MSAILPRSARKCLSSIGDDWGPVRGANAKPLSKGIWWLVAAGQVQVKTLGVGVTLVRRVG